MNVHSFLTGVQLAIRAAIGGSVSVAIAQLLELEEPFYAFVAAIIVTDLAPAQSRQLALRRLVATAIGAVCGAVLSQLLPPDP